MGFGELLWLEPQKSDVFWRPPEKETGNLKIDPHLEKEKHNLTNHQLFGVGVYLLGGFGCPCCQKLALPTLALRLHGVQTFSSY